MKIKNDNIRRKAGFTLIEVLLVVAILGVLATVVVVNVSGRREPAMIRATRASIAAVATAVDLYEVDTGRRPSSIQDLLRDSGAPNWNGPYIRGGTPLDAWGSPIELRISGGSYVVVSAGPDMQMGTSDDITSHQID